MRNKEQQSVLFFRIARMVALCCLLVMTAICYARASEVMEPADAGTTAANGQRANDGLWKQASAVWQDMRQELAKRGITFSFSYTGEVFYSYKLEPDKVTPYRDDTNLRITLDTEKLGLWPGGEVFVNGQWSYGRSIAVVAEGVTFPISNIDARNFAQISEYGIKQRLWKGAVQFIVGKQDVNTIFCTNTYGSYLVNPSYSLNPTVPIPTFPAPALGVTVIAAPWKQLYLGLGFYEGTPRIGGSGFDTFFDSSRGYFSVAETAWKPRLGEDHNLPGDYRAGFWYHTGRFAETGTGAETFNGNYGVYFLMNQMLYKKKGADPADQGLGAFLQLGWAPRDRNPVTGYVGTGLQYQGLLPFRPADIVGFGVSHTWVSAGDGATPLVSLELFYMVQIFPWFCVQPDVQYFYNTTSGQKSGLAAGCRWMVSF